MDKAYLISQIAELTARKRYLELGLYDFSNLAEIAKVVESVVGVECKIWTRRIIENARIFEMTTDEFFAQNTEKFDLIFIDADHCYDSVLKDLNNSLQCITDDGIILMHDTDPMDIEHTADGYCSNSYLIHDYLQGRSDLMYVTLPIEDAGITIVARKNSRRVLKFT